MIMLLYGYISLNFDAVLFVLYLHQHSLSLVFLLSCNHCATTVNQIWVATDWRHWLCKVLFVCGKTEQICQVLFIAISRSRHCKYFLYRKSLASHRRKLLMKRVSSAKSHVLCVSSRAPLLLRFFRLVELADIG